MEEFVSLALVAFLLHLAWESAHIRLYRNYDALKGTLPVPLWAALGDVLYTLFAVLLIALFKENIVWLEMPTTADYFGLLILGFCTALFVEYKAFYFKRWEYVENMPIVPGLRVGLSSLVQKTLLFPLAVWLTVILVRLI